MKNQNRIQLNGNAEHSVPQVQSASAPSQERILAIGIEDGLSCLQREGQAAVALCKMNAYSIQKMVEDGVEGMQNFEGGDFEQGSVELAFDLVSNFDRSFKEWEADQLGLIRGEKHSVEPWNKMGCAVVALFHVLRLQGEIITNHHPENGADSGAVECSFAVIDRLESAWRDSRAASAKFRELVSASSVAQN